METDNLDKLAESRISDYISDFNPFTEDVVFTCLLAISTPLLIIYAVVIVSKIIGLVACLSHHIKRRQIRHHEPSLKKTQPPVTIIKPIKGCDDRLEENLKSFFNLNYPNYTVHLCLENDRDSAAPLCQQLVSLYPNVAKLHYQSDTPEYHERSASFKNPKIQNMRLAWETTNTELVWMVDAKIYVEPDMLSNVVSELLGHGGEVTENLACIHSTPLFKNLREVNVEKVYFYAHHSGQYISMDMIGQPCLTGMSVLVKRSCVDRFGGLKALSSYLAEDFYMCKFLTEQGDRLKLSKYNALQNAPESHSMKPFTDRMLRWFKLRKSMVPFVAYMEPFLECLPSALYGPLALVTMTSFLANRGYWMFEQPEYFPAVMVHLLSWYGVDMVQAALCGMYPLRWSFLKCWTLKHFIFLRVYAQGLFGGLCSKSKGNVVTWCDKQYLLKDGKLEQVPTKDTLQGIRIVGHEMEKHSPPTIQRHRISSGTSRSPYFNLGKDSLATQA